MNSSLKDQTHFDWYKLNLCFILKKIKLFISFDLKNIRIIIQKLKIRIHKSWEVWIILMKIIEFMANILAMCGHTEGYNRILSLWKGQWSRFRLHSHHGVLLLHLKFRNQFPNFSKNLTFLVQNLKYRSLIGCKEQRSH